MAAHRRLKHGEQNLKCGMCQFETYDTSMLRDHKKRIHDGDEKRFNCNICDYSSHHRHDLKQHTTQMHNTGEDMVKCDKCLYQTTTKSNLKGTPDGDIKSIKYVHSVLLVVVNQVWQRT